MGKAKSPAMTAELNALTGGPHLQGGESNPNPFAVPPSRVGLYMTEDHWYYVNGEGPYLSVTTALGIIDKPYLRQWAIDQTATHAMLHLPELLALGTVEDGVKFLRGVPNAIRDRAADLGTLVHHQSESQGSTAVMPIGASQTASNGFEVPSEAFPYLEAYQGFLAFLEAHRGTIVSSEKAIWNQTEGYAGTYDRLIRFECECHFGLWLIDLKTGKHWYDWYGLQLSGYSHGEYIVLPDDPTLYPMPSVDRVGVLHLRPDVYEGPFKSGWRLVEYPVTDRDWVAFLAALELYRWSAEGRFKKSILNKTVSL